MEIITLTIRDDSIQNQKLTKAYEKMERLLAELKKKSVPEACVEVVNAEIQRINTFSGSEKELVTLLNKSCTKLLVYLEKELQLVAKLHYQKRWMVFGMMAGMLLSIIAKNFIEDATWSSISMGISMGLLFGLLAGRNRDKEAEKNGHQLDI